MAKNKNVPRVWRNPRNHSIAITNTTGLFEQSACTGQTIFLAQSKKHSEEFAGQLRQVFYDTLRVHKTDRMVIQTTADMDGQIIGTTPWQLFPIEDKLTQIFGMYSRITGERAKMQLRDETVLFSDLIAPEPIMFAHVTIKGRGGHMGYLYHSPDPGVIAYYPDGAQIPPAFRRTEEDMSYCMVITPANSK